MFGTGQAQRRRGGCDRSGDLGATGTHLRAEKDDHRGGGEGVPGQQQGLPGASPGCCLPGWWLPAQQQPQPGAEQPGRHEGGTQPREEVPGVDRPGGPGENSRGQVQPGWIRADDAVDPPVRNSCRQAQARCRHVRVQGGARRIRRVPEVSWQQETPVGVPDLAQRVIAECPRRLYLRERDSVAEDLSVSRGHGLRVMARLVRGGSQRIGQRPQQNPAGQRTEKEQRRTAHPGAGQPRSPHPCLPPPGKVLADNMWRSSRRDVPAARRTGPQ